jgi:hypothetical protein
VTIPNLGVNWSLDRTLVSCNSKIGSDFPIKLQRQLPNASKALALLVELLAFSCNWRQFCFEQKFQMLPVAPAAA